VNIAIPANRVTLKSLEAVLVNKGSPGHLPETK